MFLQNSGNQESIVNIHGRGNLKSDATSLSLVRGSFQKAVASSECIYSVKLSHNECIIIIIINCKRGGSR